MLKFNKIRETGIVGSVATDLVNDFNLPLQVHFGQISLTTANSSIHQRRAECQLIDENDNLFFDAHSGTSQGSNRADLHHEFMQGIFREVSIIGTSIQVPIPFEFIIPPGWTFRALIDNGTFEDRYDAMFLFSEFVR